MSIQEINGNIFNSNAEALVNTVNCKGVMGRGIALEFRRRFPKMFTQYKIDCETGLYNPGNAYWFEERGRKIINCTVKDDWKQPSKMIWVSDCLDQIVEKVRSKLIQSLAMPLMGTQNGKLPIHQVHQLMLKKLEAINSIEIELYHFNPMSGDPLFEKLEILIARNSITDFQKIISFRKDLSEKLYCAVKNGRVSSLSMLSSKKILGEKSIDNLYQFLIDYDEKKFSGQLSLF